MLHEHLPEELAEILKLKYLGNTVEDYVTALILLIAVFIVLLFIKRVVLHHFKKLTKYTKAKYDDIIIDSLRKFRKVELLVISLYISTLALDINKTMSLVITALAVAVMTVRAIMLLHQLIMEVVRSKALTDEDELPADRASMLKNVNIILKVALWSCGILFVLNNLGINITAAIAGLGIGGVAVALAAQSVLGDAFNSFAIYMDKPFVVGDFIIIDSFMGVVEHIGIKTTRIRSLQGEQLVFSNTDLTNSRIHNFKRMDQRRVAFMIGVTYQTPSEKLKKIPDIVKKIVEGIENTKFDRTHFKAYGNFSLDFEIVYYIFAADYNIYMDIQQRMNLEIYEAFEKEGIEFAYPTQTLYVNKES